MISNYPYTLVNDLFSPHKGNCSLQLLTESEVVLQKLYFNSQVQVLLHPSAACFLSHDHHLSFVAHKTICDRKGASISILLAVLLVVPLQDSDWRLHFSGSPSSMESNFQYLVLLYWWNTILCVNLCEITVLSVQIHKILYKINI